jgi:ATP-binding cassette subfamily E protein 1
MVKKGEGTKEENKLTRIAIVNADRCKPKKCHQECKKNCPVVRIGKLCIEVKPTDKLAFISEELCVGCGICVKKCPFEAISIINLPKNLDRDTTHRYGPNSFKLHRLPLPRPGQVLGLVGTNGIGKSTALKILAGKQKPNLGKFDNPPDWEDILTYFRGSELQGFFTRILEDNLKAIIKPQYVDHIPRAAKGTVISILTAKDERGVKDEMIKALDLTSVLNRNIQDLSGGELQRFAIAVGCVQKADIYMFDEPSSYLDIRQRLKAAQVIRNLNNPENYIICVEHDLSILDYLSDFICCLYGIPGAYGVVTMPFGVREGINIFLAGFVPTENLRFREESITFKVSENLEELYGDDKSRLKYKYPGMKKSFTGFELTVDAGSFNDSEIIVLLGENGTGKTTFIKMLAGKLKPDDESVNVPELNVSYKPQTISPKFEGSVRDLLLLKVKDAFLNAQFQSDVIKPMSINNILDQKVTHLSGGELQRVALILALGTPADVYLIDEPSAYLDSEQRLIAAKIIKRFILHAKKTAFIVEHDFIMATYLADRVIVYEGTPSVCAHANTPQSLVTGMNKFLKSLDVTFRRDPTNYRPRINKLNSVKDKEQKEMGMYFYIDTDDDEDDVTGSKKAKAKAKHQAEKEKEAKKEESKPKKKKGDQE